MSLLVVVACVSAFAVAADGPYLLDDGPLIVRNSMLHSGFDFAQTLQADFWDVDSAQAQLEDRLGYFRPLVLASYALDWRIGGGGPLSFHLTNLALHGLACLLAFWTLRRWMGRCVPAAVAALAFGLHPSHAENVAWISGRPDLLLVVGLLMASLGMAVRLREGATPAGGGLGVALEVLGTLVAYLSKEHAVVLPALALVEAWVARGRPALSARVLVASLGRASVQIAVMLAYLAVRIWVLPLRDFEVRGLQPEAQLTLVFETLGRLHELFFFPSDLSLSRAMLRTGPSGPLSSEFHVALGVLSLGASLVLAVAFRRRAALVLALALWWGFCLPVSNVVWTGMANLTSPRFLYLPSLALAWWLAELAVWVVARARRGAGPLWAVAGAGVAALGWLSVVRSRDFRSETAFWNAELTAQPNAVLPHAFAVTYERGRRRPRRALALAARGFSVTARDFSHDALRAQLVLAALELLAEVTLDVDADTLSGLDAFVVDLVEARPARLRWAEGWLVVEPDSRLQRDLLRHRPRLDLLRADLASRRGDDAAALSLARGAVEACPRCAREWQSAALIALRSSDRPSAVRWFRGPRGREFADVPVHVRVMAQRSWQLQEQASTAGPTRRVQLRAERFGQLGLAGRAYAALRPHRDEILAAGLEPTRSYALAAFRAGDAAEARRVLRHREPSAERVETRLERWARQLGRRDAPVEPHERRYAQTVAALLEEPLRNQKQAAR